MMLPQPERPTLAGAGQTVLCGGCGRRYRLVTEKGKRADNVICPYCGALDLADEDE